MADIFEIAGRVHSTSQEGVTTVASEILDESKGKKQSEVNAETDATLAEHTSTINGLNSQNYVTVTATDQTTAVTDVLPATGEVATVYRVGNWDGSQYDETCYSEYSWNGSAYVHLSTKTQIGEVFDISAYHATGGTLATYADLSAALDSNNNGGVPQSLQRGGMSVKFVQSSDNKYVQYRLMAQNFTTNTTQWQSMNADDELTAGSDNLAKSGVLYRELYGDTEVKVIDFSTQTFYGCNISDNGGTYKVSNLNWPEKFSVYIIDCQGYEKVSVQANSDATARLLFLASFPTIEQGSVVDVITETTIAAGTVEELPIPANCLYISVDRRRYNTTTNYTPSSCELESHTIGINEKIEELINSGYLYAGVATIETNPITPTNKVFYIATAAGTYVNFDSQVLPKGINILKWNGSAWSSEQIIGVDDVPTNGSPNPLSSGGVYEILNGSIEESVIDFSTETFYACRIQNDGANTYKVFNLDWPEKYSCYIIEREDYEKINVTANNDDNAHLVYLRSFPTIETAAVADAIYETFIAAGASEELVIPDGCNYIYINRILNFVLHTPSLFKLSKHTDGINNKVERNTQDIENIQTDIETANEDIDKLTTSVFSDTIELAEIPYGYLDGVKIYLRNINFSCYYAYVKKGTYKLTIKGAISIQTSDATRVGFTNTQPAENVLYTPLVSYTYRKSEEKEILFSIESDCYVVIGNYKSQATIKLEPVPVISKDYNKTIIHVQKDGHGRFSSVVDAIDHVTDGTPSDIYIHAGTYNLHEDWTSEQISNANYEDVVNGVAGAWCGTPVKDNMSLIGFDGRKKVIIHAEVPDGTPTYNEISTLNPMGNVEMRDLTITSTHLRYTIHDDFPYNNVDKVHKYIDCDIFKYNGSQPAIGAARCSGEDIIIDGCYIDYFTCHAAYGFYQPSKIFIRDTTINYSLGIIDHNTGFECPVVLENVNVNVIAYGTSASSGTPAYATLTIRGGNLPMISGWETYIHDGVVLKKSTVSNITKGQAVKCSDFYGVAPLSASDDNSVFFGIALIDAPLTPNTVHNAYPIITKGYVPTSLVGISSFNVGDTVGIVSGEVVISSTNVIGRVVCQDGTDGYILLN